MDNNRDLASLLVEQSEAISERPFTSTFAWWAKDITSKLDDSIIIESPIDEKIFNDVIIESEINYDVLYEKRAEISKFLKPLYKNIDTYIDQLNSVYSTSHICMYYENRLAILKKRRPLTYELIMFRELGEDNTELMTGISINSGPKRIHSRYIRIYNIFTHGDQHTDVPITRTETIEKSFKREAIKVFQHLAFFSFVNKNYPKDTPEDYVQAQLLEIRSLFNS